MHLVWCPSSPDCSSTKLRCVCPVIVSRAAHDCLVHSNDCFLADSPPSSFFNRFYIIEIDANNLPAPRRFYPPLSFDAIQASKELPWPTRTAATTTTTTASLPIPEQGSDVEFKTVIINTQASKELPQDTIPNLLAGWVKEQTSTSVASVPWPTRTAATTTTTASLPSPWPVATSTPFPVLQISRFNPSPVSSLFACGQEGTTTPFIQRGVEFPRGRYPWLTAIYHKESFALAFKCGGSLISTSLVITAAHCVYKVNEDRVLVAIGRYDLDNYHEDGAETRDVQRILLHPDFSSRLNQQPDADIALITVRRPVT